MHMRKDSTSIEGEINTQIVIKFNSHQIIKRNFLSDTYVIKLFYLAAIQTNTDTQQSIHTKYTYTLNLL